jgi:hypothetical protein
VLGCAKQHESKLAPAERDAALEASKDCVDNADSLAPSYQMIGPRLAQALKLDRTEAQHLMRDSIELLIATRELLCNVSQNTVDAALAKDPDDADVVAARARMRAAQDHLQKARSAYDALLGATSAAQPPVDEAALVDRMQHALLGN